MRGHGGRICGHPDRRQAGVRHALHRPPAHDAGNPDDGGWGFEDGLPDARDGQDRADAHHRVGRRQHKDVRLPDRVQHAGCRGGGVDAHEHELMGGQSGAVLHPPLLEVNGGPALLGVHHYVGLDTVVRHGQQRHSRLPPRAQGCGDLVQRVPGREQLCAHQVGGDVAVPEREPQRIEAVRPKFVEDPVGLVTATPSALEVDPAAEGVHDGVQVGADLQSVQPDVIRGVADHGDLVIREGGPQALQEPGATHAARQHRDPHPTVPPVPHRGLGFARDSTSGSRAC